MTTLDQVLSSLAVSNGGERLAINGGRGGRIQIEKRAVGQHADVVSWLSPEQLLIWHASKRFFVLDLQDDGQSWAEDADCFVNLSTRQSVDETNFSFAHEPSLAVHSSRGDVWLAEGFYGWSMVHTNLVRASP